MFFDAKKETEIIVEFIRNYYLEHNLGGVVLGVSGGKDSAVVAALFVEALGKENVLGLTLPCHSNDDDRNDAKLVSDYYGFNLLNFDLTKVFDDFKEELFKIDAFSGSDTLNSDINLKPRLRMSTLYYFAALYSSLTGKPYLVAGTSNKCEIYVGYFTKGGDNVHDISVLADLTVEEVIKIGEYLKVPEKVLHKVPSDGLSGVSDEEKLGVKYSDIEKYFFDRDILSKDVVDRIEKLHSNNLHKFNIPTYRKD